MDAILNDIVVHGASMGKSINVSLLRQHTRKLQGASHKKLRWTKIRHLYLLGANEGTENLGYEVSPGTYVNDTQEWVLLVGISSAKISECVARCTKALEVLNIRFSDFQVLSLGKLTGLEEVIVNNCPHFATVWGLNQLTQLRRLDFTNTSIGAELDLSGLVNLEELCLDQTFVSNLRLEGIYDRLHSLHARHTQLSDAGFLVHFPAVRTVDLAHNPITQFSVNWRFTQLEELDLSCTAIEQLDDGCFDSTPNLTYLSLRALPIARLPNSIGTLRWLQELDLSELRLRELPRWLAELGLEFSLDQGSGIRLRDTAIDGVDMSIFAQSRNVICKWLRDTEAHSIEKRVKQKISFLVDVSGSMASGMCALADQSRRFFMNYPGFEIAPIIFDAPLPDNIPPLEPRYAYGPISRGYIPRTRCSVPDDFEWACQRKNMLDAILIDPSAPKEVLSPASSEPEEEQDEPLNEIKVVFLGDGAAGKSLTIARLMADGTIPADFDGNATPGIAIHDREYDLPDGRHVQVHFWDFGGQEIMHSMHRMFLTERTLYVVILNARDDTQDDRAQYWIDNVRGFAPNCPVLMVLNQIDQNPNASVRERELRKRNPELGPLIRMSALMDSDDTFRRSFTDVMLAEIAKFRSLSTPFRGSWQRLKKELRGMRTAYIHGAEYRALCKKCGVEQESIKDLLNWFSDLGVSFCYRGSDRLEDYVILRPEWITNAIYTILWNKQETVTNGLINRDEIYRLLNPGEDENVQRVNPNQTYSYEETDFVLGVIRKFRLSYLVDDKKEFIPMLCKRDPAPIADEYSADPDTLEFKMTYEYLPNNVIHRLMVERYRNLMQDGVWRTGAHFKYDNTGLSAVVSSENNVIRILVRSRNPRFTPDLYLDILKDDILRISRSLNQEPSGRFVVYKTQNGAEEFNYDFLTLCLQNNIPSIPSMKTGRLIQISEILRQTDHGLDEDRRQFLQNLAAACHTMQSHRVNWDRNEDDRTLCIEQQLTPRGYIVKPQYRQGRSETGISDGQLDLRIELDNGILWTVFEALNIKGSGKNQIKNWNSHLKKLLDYYNPTGLPFLFLTSYVECEKEKFNDICKTFYEHLKVHSPADFQLEADATRTVDLSAPGHPRNNFLRAYQCVYNCRGSVMTVYHFFVRVGD